MGRREERMHSGDHGRINESLQQVISATGESVSDRQETEALGVILSQDF